MVETFEAANVEEAIELASRLKSEGRYQWFRGQLRAWPPYSTLARSLRGDAGSQERLERRLSIFMKWVGNIPELRHLTEERNVDQVFAILQHYGLPTHYIDFTTDPAVAGFFATDGQAEGDDDGPSCIYCLDIDDLLETWQAIRLSGERDGAEIERIEIDVSNLWRLEAQRGVFLYANYNWDVDYPMDRILFPPSVSSVYPSRERIYPVDKSPLEQLLDQYFSLEQATFTNEMLERRFGRNFMRLSPLPRGVDADAFADASKLEEHPSWSPQQIAPWTVAPQERFDDAIGGEETLRLDPAADWEAVRRAVTSGARRMVESRPDLRRRTLLWTLESPPPALPADLYREQARHLWNGMRRLPYSDWEIAEALGALAALLMLKPDPDKGDLSFSRVFGPAVEVGFAADDLSGSYASAGLAALRAALRPDLPELLAEPHRIRAQDPVEALRVAYNPRLAFQFEPFKTLFATQIVPAQLVLRRSPVLFNPARLSAFGNA